jgi:hypothetical protein
MFADAIAHTGALIDILLALVCGGILAFGLRILRNPVAFWDQFNPYLKPYGRSTLILGRVIGSLWTFSAASACIILVGNAVRASLLHHWVR